MREPPKPICIQGPEEKTVCLITFHSGLEEERKAAIVLLLTHHDFDENRNIKNIDNSYMENTFQELPGFLQEILKNNFVDITNDSFVVMRFFKNEENGKWFPLFLHNEKELTKF